MDVMDLNWRWNAEGLIRAAEASSPMRIDSEKRSRREWIARMIGAGVALRHGHVYHFAAVRAGQEPVADLAHDRGVEDRNRLRGVEEAHHPQRAVRQRAVEVRDEDASPRVPTHLRRGVQTLHAVHDFAHDPEIELDE